MQSQNSKWLIIRTIGLLLLCASVYHLYYWAISILSLGTAVDCGNSDSCTRTHLEPIYEKIWFISKELFIWGAMAYYFLTNGTFVFKLLSNKETSND